MATAPAVRPQRPSLLLGDDVLASLLIRHHVAPEADVARCFEEAASRGLFLDECAVAAGLATREELLALLASHFGCPSCDLESERPAPEALALLPSSVSLRHLVLPWRLEDGALRVVMAEPDRPRLRDLIARASGRRVLPAVALRHELWSAIQSHFGPRTVPAPAPEPAASAPPPAPRTAPVGADASSVVDAMLSMAVERGATDIHVEPSETELAVRLRVDGILTPGLRLPAALAGSIASRLKVLSGMDIAERRAPQDGRATFTVRDETLDVRSSSLPSKWGEKIVMRLLRRDASLLDARNLRMPPDVRARHREMLEAPMGLFLVTGPTGSGKTTTLYATLGAVDRDEHSVVTLEDPIEYQLAGVTQVQINETAGLTFAAGLKSILRQDPDVILVGEIREAATAEIACKAALTGHKVFSTLHANDSCQAVTRLADMGVARDLIAATLDGVIAQRLLRKPCASCRTQRPLTDVERRALGPSAPASACFPAGCPACSRTGYKGRFAVFEYFKLDEDMGRLVLERTSAGALKAAARRRGMRTMLDAGRDAVASGDTTIAEVQRVLMSADGSEDACPRCGRGVSPDFASCPHCMQALHESCRRCGASVQEGWRACAACGTPREDRREAPTCLRCAAPLESGWSACPYCSHPAQAPA